MPGLYDSSVGMIQGAFGGLPDAYAQVKARDVSPFQQALANYLTGKWDKATAVAHANGEPMPQTGGVQGAPMPQQGAPYDEGIGFAAGQQAAQSVGGLVGGGQPQVPQMDFMPESAPRQGLGGYDMRSPQAAMRPSVGGGIGGQASPSFPPLSDQEDFNALMQASPMLRPPRQERDYLAEILARGDVQKDVANINVGGRKEVANVNANAGNQRAETRAGAQKYGADIGLEREKIRAKAGLDRAAIMASVQRAKLAKTPAAKSGADKDLAQLENNLAREIAAAQGAASRVASTDAATMPDGQAFVAEAQQRVEELQGQLDSVRAQRIQMKTALESAPKPTQRSRPIKEADRGKPGFEPGSTGGGGKWVVSPDGTEWLLNKK